VIGHLVYVLPVIVVGAIVRRLVYRAMRRRGL
jgi:hypothetical protein